MAENEELRDLCINIQVKTRLTDKGWEKQFGNDGGLYALIQAHKQRWELEAAVKERRAEYQELLKEYRFTAHNSGFGRQLSTNMARTIKRVTELESELAALSKGEK